MVSSPVPEAPARPRGLACGGPHGAGAAAPVGRGALRAGPGRGGRGPCARGRRRPGWRPARGGRGRGVPLPQHPPAVPTDARGTARRTPEAPPRREKAGEAAQAQCAREHGEGALRRRGGVPGGPGRAAGARNRLWASEIPRGLKAHPSFLNNLHQPSTELDARPHGGTATLSPEARCIHHRARSPGCPRREVCCAHRGVGRRQRPVRSPA